MGFWNILGLGIPNAISNLTNKGDTKNENGQDLTAGTLNGKTGFTDKTYKPGDIAYEGLSNNQDSLTQFFRSFENAQAKSGQEKNVLGQEGYRVGTEGLDQSQRDLQPTIDYFTRLLGGDRNEIESAAGPQIDQIGQQFDQIRQMSSETTARGGGKASTQVNNRQQQIAQITQLINQLRAQAAGGLSQAAGTRAGIAGTRGQLALGESQLGFQDLQSAIQAAESAKGYTVQESNANKSAATSLGTQTMSSLI